MMSDNEQENESVAEAAATPPAANFGIGPSEPTIQAGAETPAGPGSAQPADVGAVPVPLADAGGVPPADAGTEAGQPGQQWSGTSYDPAAQPGGEFAQPAGGFAPPADQLGGVQPGPRRKTGLIIGAAAAVAVIVVVAVVFIVTRGSGSQSPAQALASAEQSAGQITRGTATFSSQVGGVSTISGTMAFQRSPLIIEENLTETANGQSVPISGIVTPSAMYLKSSVLLKGSPKPWIKIPLAQLPAGSAFLSLLHSLQNQNPMSQERLFAGAKHVRADGHQVVDGVSTAKYSGTFAPLAAVKYLPAGSRSVFRSLLSQVQGDVHFTMWIGANNQIKKFTEVETVQTETVTTTVTYNSINQPVNITLPPASQVAVAPASALGGGV